MRRIQQNLPYIALVAVYLCWSTTFATIHIGLQTLPPAVLACQRFFVSGIILSLIGFGKHRQLYPNRRALGVNLLIGLLLFGVGNGLTPWPLMTLPTGIAAAIVALNPFWMVGLSAIIPPKEKLTPPIAVAFGLGGLGMLILLAPQWQAAFGGGGNALQMLVAALVLLLIDVGWCSGSLLARQQGEHVPAGRHYFALVGQQNLLVSVIFAGVALAQGQMPWAIPTLTSGLAVVYLGIFGTCVGMMAYLYTLNTLPLPVASTCAYVTPVLTAWLGVVALGETFHWTLVVGLCLILLSVALIQSATKRRRPYWPLPARPTYHLVRWFKAGAFWPKTNHTTAPLTARFLPVDTATRLNHRWRHGEYTLRPITAADNEAMKTVILSVLTEHGCIGQGYASGDDETQAMSHYYNGTDNQYWVITDETGTVLGGGGFSRLKGTSTAHGIAELQKLYFLPELRGKGLAKALVSQCVASAQACGYRQLYLETVPQMATAQGLYLALGFTPIAHHLGTTGHHERCTVRMVLDLTTIATRQTPLTKTPNLLEAGR